MNITIFSLFHVIGIIISFAFVFFLSQKKQLPFNKIYWCLFTLIFILGLGSKICGYIFFDLNHNNFFSITSESTIFGALFLFLLTIPILSKIYKLRLGLAIDISSFFIIIIQFFAKIGCFFAGCCYGCPTHLFWGINPTSLSKLYGQSIKIHPVQLFDAAFVLLIFLLLYKLSMSNKKIFGTGIITAIYLSLYSIERFFTEFLRGDYTPIYGFLKMGQILSIILFIIGFIMFTILLKKLHSSKT